MAKNEKAPSSTASCLHQADKRFLVMYTHGVSFLVSLDQVLC